MKQEDSSGHVAFIGAGALGAFAGAWMTRAGHRVTLVDPWGAHVETMRSDGLRVSGTHVDHRIPVTALHVGEVQRLVRTPVNVAFICAKLYDTRWCAALITPYLAPNGFIVTMQNGFVEEEVAQVVGWRRVLGCIASRVQVELLEPGHVRRSNPPGGTRYTAFRVGEMHGQVTPRASRVAQLLQTVDSAHVISNLWGERWSKLVANSMTSPVCGISGLPFSAMYSHQGATRLIVRLAAEAIGVGRALGFALEPIFGMHPDEYVAAAHGDMSARERVRENLCASQAHGIEGGRSGIAQDLAKGRRTEVDYLNGYVVEQAKLVGASSNTQMAITAMVHAMEHGELLPRVRKHRPAALVIREPTSDRARVQQGRRVEGANANSASSNSIARSLTCPIARA